MTLEQGLQRLAELDGEFIIYSAEDEMFYIPSYPMEFHSLGGYDRETLDKLFGAVCARISSKNWYWEKYKNKFWIMDSGTRVVVSSYPIAGNPAHAAVLAYVAALEGMREKCPECDNGVVVNGLDDIGDPFIEPCPACNGTDKKQEAPA